MIGIFTRTSICGGIPVSHPFLFPHLLSRLKTSLFLWIKIHTFPAVFLEILSRAHHQRSRWQKCKASKSVWSECDSNKPHRAADVALRSDLSYTSRNVINAFANQTKLFINTQQGSFTSWLSKTKRTLRTSICFLFNG